jgi:hypothetical protein
MRPKSKYQGYWDNSKKTMVETEAFYEDLRCDLFGTGNLSHSTGYEPSRNAGWMSNLCGCAGFTYGAHGVWGVRWDKDPKFGGWCDGYNSEPWYMGVEKPWGNEVKYMKRFFELIDFRRITPTFYDTFYGEFSDNERAVLATDKNTLYALYLYGKVQITGKLKALDENKTYTSYWYDTRTGRFIKEKEFTGVSEYEIPARPDKNDWTLLVTNEDLGIVCDGSFYKTKALKKAVGTPVPFKAFTVFTDNTTQTENLEKGELWRPFAACASNIIKIDLGKEYDLACVELNLEKNKMGEYSYRIDGNIEDEIYVLSDRISKKTSDKDVIESVSGKFRYLTINFTSEPGYIDDEKRIVAGIEKITVYVK